MFIFDFCFFFSMFIVCSTRYYAFVETLFIIDPQYFPAMSSISYEDYVQTMVNTANIIFQSSNDLDVKIEMVVSKILQLNIAEPRKQDPTAYERKVRQQVPDYDRYDSIALFWYQPWEGEKGAQGYAMLNGVCNPQLKLFYLVPHQNAAFYLAHEFGHQLGLGHQVDGPCFTESHMSVMTVAHTASYERARWSSCENKWINEKICSFECLFNQPANYRPIKNKFSTLPGQTMQNEQQAKMIDMNSNRLGEASHITYHESQTTSRCLYFQYYVDPSRSKSMFGFTPMLPGSTCGPGDSICYMDKCSPKSEIDPEALQIAYDDNVLNLKSQCSSEPATIATALSESNDDPRQPMTCDDWEDDFLCVSKRECPDSGQNDVAALYMNHVCCGKCTKNFDKLIAVFGHAESIEITWISISLPLLILISRSRSFF